VRCDAPRVLPARAPGDAGPGMQELLSQGIELIGFAVNDEATPLRSPHEYLALWRMADAS